MICFDLKKFSRLLRGCSTPLVLVTVFGLSGSMGADATVQRAPMHLYRNADVLPATPAADLLVTHTPPAEALQPRIDNGIAEVHQSNARVIMMEVTAYCPCQACCGPQAQGITASGKHVSYNDGRFVAADTSILPFGTQISIPGYHDGQVVEVIDRGGAIKGNKLDVYFSNHEVARRWGRQKIPVVVMEP